MFHFGQYYLSFMEVVIEKLLAEKQTPQIMIRIRKYRDVQADHGLHQWQRQTQF